MSFDLGPTLADWLEEHQPDVYAKIIESERKHFERFGVSNALAQPYNHTILPLSFHHRDKWLQIMWGLQDYEHRFGHPATGMWLPETAVDLYTLWVMAYCGIQYTILAPWQAETPVDSTEPYIVKLPRLDGKERTITVFFYHDKLSGPVSFEDSITDNADRFALEELPKHQNSRKRDTGIPQLTLIATDGELYGHHKKGRDKFLKRLFTYSAKEAGVEIISLERYMRLHPPTKEVKIREYTSWSCNHGIARWETGCDCDRGGGFNSWKVQYNQTSHKLYEEAYKLFEEHMRPAIPKMHEARNAYLSLRNGWMSEEAFWKKWGRDHRKPKDVLLYCTTWLLMEAEYYLQRSFASCGTYWDALGIEAQNNIRFARYAIMLMKRATDADLSHILLEVQKKTA